MSALSSWYDEYRMRLPVLFAATILMLIGLPRAAQPEAALDEESEVRDAATKVRGVE